jgi:hypothetical protein
LERIIYKTKDGVFVKGAIFNLLLNHGDFTLVELRVYSDGELDCLGPITLDQLVAHLESGRLTRSLPAKSKIFIPYIGHIISEYNAPKIYSDQRFIELIKQTIQKLNDAEDLRGECLSSFKDWLLNPSRINFEKLKDLYLKLPEGKKALLEIDYKDPLIRLMKNGFMTKEEREYCLNDYFEGEWIELKE